MDAGDVEEVIDQPVHLRDEAPVRAGALPYVLASHTFGREPEEEVRVDREPTQDRTQVVAGVGEELVPRRDQLVGETTLARQIVVGGFPLEREEVVQIASSRLALALEQRVGGGALSAERAVLQRSLTLGTRLGVLQLAISFVPRGLDDLVSALAGSLHHLIGRLGFVSLPQADVGLVAFRAQALVGAVTVRALHALRGVLWRRHTLSPRLESR
ncbi:MAG TPA: hypothetical protein VGQ83_11700 [Polyangia bacterium]